MPFLPPNKLKKFAGDKKGGGKAALAKFAKKKHNGGDDEDEHDEDEEDEKNHGHSHDGSDHDDDGHPDHHEGGSDDDHGDDHGGDKHGGGANLSKAEKDAQAGSDKEIEGHLADHDSSDEGTPEWVADEGTWNKAKSMLEPKWEEYDEPVSVQAYLYKALGGKFK